MSSVAGLLRRAAGPREPVQVAAGQSLISVRGASVTRGERNVLHEVDLNIAAGEVVTLVGPNGAGKSTLLEAIAGDLEVSAGTVELDGAPVSDWTPVESAMRRAVLLQRVTLAFPFSVTEVVAMGRAPWAGTEREDEDEAMVVAAMDAAEVSDLKKRSFGTLSGGERARVALARVLAQQTQVLLLDEPTAALDIRHQELVMELARDRARQDAAAVLVVMHDLAAAAAFADRMVIIHDGRIRADGPVEDVLDERLLSEVYERPIEVIAHPRTGAPIVLPRRDL